MINSDEKEKEVIFGLELEELQEAQLVDGEGQPHREFQGRDNSLYNGPLE